jgi:bifunctional non-homologous end joining protein LigD
MSDHKLAKYQSMRDFGSTPEPAGMVVETGDRPRFVVQRHRATRLHYDLRLEVGGVLVSWAVPKGPSLDPKRKNLAMKVEDHPFQYGWFEGNIGSGYGKGDVIIWDDGWWEPDPAYPESADPERALADGELKFITHGHKLHGRWVIIRTGGRGRAGASSARDEDQWLLMHKNDDAAVPGWDPEDHPHSVLSARTNVDVVEGRPGRWIGPTKAELKALDAIKDKGHWSIAGETTLLTNLDKVFMPGARGSRRSPSARSCATTRRSRRG